MKRAKRVAAAVGGLLLLVVIAFVVTGPPKVSAAAIRSSVTRDAALLVRAGALPVAARYGRITSQSNGSYCGPSSLANVFRSFGDATTERQVLDGTGFCWTGRCIPGLTLDELAGIARGHGSRKVTVLRDLTPEEFREHLRRSNDPSRRYTVNFSRKPIFGAGGGHHSPIGGYLEAEDLVLVLDVNPDFGPWLVEADRLFRAMDTMDGDQKRGLLMIE